MEDSEQKRHRLLIAAFKAIKAVMSNTTISKADTIEDLQELREDIDVRLDALKRDL